MLWRLQLENEPRKKRKPWDTKARRFYVPSGSLPWKQTEQTRQLKARLKAFKKALKPTRAPFERALKRSMTSRTYNTVHKVNRTIQRTANTGRFIVKPADKGLGPCVMDTTDYTQRCLTFLGSDEQYRLLAANDSPSREQTLESPSWPASTRSLSKVVDLYLQPLIDRGVVLKDSTHLLNHFLAVAIPWILKNCIFEFAENVSRSKRKSSRSSAPCHCHRTACTGGSLTTASCYGQTRCKRHNCSLVSA